MDSTGLIVLTNDGELTQRLTHPRHGISKTYVVEIAGRLNEKQMASLKAPAYLDGRKTSGLKVKSLRRGHDRSVLEITLREGRNREIRRLLARLGHKVFRLKRTAIGPITDRGVKVGNYRTLNRTEVATLLKTGSAHDAGDTSSGKTPVRRRKSARRSSSSTTKRPAARRRNDRRKSSPGAKRRRRPK
jgi:23S rRNA pseudouridine2605 synthase